MSRLYLLDFSLIAWVGNLSWQYVNSMNCMVFDGVEFSGGRLSLGAPIIHRMSGLRQAMHVHGV